MCLRPSRVLVSCAEQSQPHSGLREIHEVLVENGAITFPEPFYFEAEARVLLAWLRKGYYWYGIYDEEEISVIGRLLQLLSKVKDDSLKNEIKEELKKH